MKELGRLTNQAPHPRLELGVNIMSDGPKSPEQPKPIEPEKSQESRPVDKTVPPEKIEAARLAWIKHNEGRVVGVDEQRVIDEIVRRGIGPEEVTPEKVEAARKAWEDVKLLDDKGNSVQASEQEGVKELIKMGITPDEYASTYDVMHRPGAMAVPPPPNPTAAQVTAVVERGQLDITRLPEVLGYSPRVRDEYFNNIFEVVDASPHEFFQQAFTFENQQRLSEFMKIVLNASKEPTIDPTIRAQLQADYDRYQLQRRIREGTHNVNAILYIPSIKAEQLFEHLQSVESLIGDAANRALGVTDMANILERVLREEMRKNEGYLRPEAITGMIKTDPVQRRDPATGMLVFDPVTGNPVYDDVVVEVKEGDVERRVKEIFMQQVARNNGIFTRDENGQAVLINKTFESWEVNRVFITARAVMIMSERLLSIAAEGKMGRGFGHWHSLFLQDILQGYSAIYHGLGKFGFTEEHAAMLLQDPEKDVDKLFGSVGKALHLLSLWNPKEYEQAYKNFTDNPKSILESDTEFFAIQQQNPFRVGDMLSIQAWRFIEDPDEPSIIQEMVAKGRERMGLRWDMYHPGQPTFDVYEEFMKRTQFRVPRNATKAQKEAILKSRREAWEATYPVAPTIEEYIRYANEYFKWIGTAVRFDTLRTTLDKLKKPQKNATAAEVISLWQGQVDKARQKWLKSKKNEDRESFEKLENADKIIERMVRLQPHRLYDKSPDIKKRVDQNLFAYLHFPPDEAHHTPAQRAIVQKILDNFYSIERRLFIERERLLHEGKTFDSNALSLDEFFNMPDMFVDDPVLGLDAATQKDHAIHFRDFFIDDYNTKKDKYLIELVYRRNYKHGFVLWSGDVPWDEYRLTAVGPTGSFARRARDNKTTGEAATELFKMMGQLDKFKSLDQAIPFLRVVYDKIAIYSPDRAKEVIADFAIGLAKFFVERPTTNIPGWGFFERQFLRPSFAKIIYGETGLASGAAEVRNFFNTLYNHEHMITKDKHKEILKEKVPGSKLDMEVNVASVISQLIALAMLLGFLNELFKKKH